MNDSLQSQAGRYLGVGMTWALSTALFLYLGSLLDKKLGTEPWFTVIGSFVGGAAGFYYLYTQVSREVKKPRSGVAQSDRADPADATDPADREERQ